MDEDKSKDTISNVDNNKIDDKVDTKSKEEQNKSQLTNSKPKEEDKSLDFEDLKKDFED